MSPCSADNNKKQIQKEIKDEKARNRKNRRTKNRKQETEYKRYIIINKRQDKETINENSFCAPRRAKLRERLSDGTREDTGTAAGGQAAPRGDRGNLGLPHGTCSGDGGSYGKGAGTAGAYSGFYA
jgi:hypothetical protein